MHRSFKKIVTLILTAGMILCSSTGFAAPQGGRVVAGSATISQQNTATVINQGSNRAIINWNSFDIGKQESVQHNMPSAQSAGLHRVVGGGGASQIAGKLQSNGNIYLVNPAGVTIHKGAQVRTNSFTATSRDISNENFMKGNMVFDKPGRPDAKIINEGTITVSENGLAALVGPTVRNDGVIAGKLGKVVLASGDSTYKLDMHGDELITFTVDEQAVNTLYAPDGTPLSAPEAKNAGTIKTEGGVVVLTASQLDGIVGQVVNTGHIEAGGISLKGKGNKVDVANTGTLNASNTAGNGGSVRLTGEAKVTAAGNIEARGSNKGGSVVVTGREVAVATNTKIDASGSQGGGTILIGGNYQGQGPERNAEKTSVAATARINADATAKGDGGQVVVWSDGETTFDGAISAKGGSEGGDGGNVETSGKILKIGDAAWVNTSALNGSFGTWLLDPVDFVVAAEGGDISGAQLSQNLLRSNILVQSTLGSNSGHGDIIVTDNISWSENTMLRLEAINNVRIIADITATGDNSGLEISSNNDKEIDISGARIRLTGANPSLMLGNNNYIVINDVNALQNIKNNISGNYALGCDIDASATKNWNGGAGFAPIGELNPNVHGHLEWPEASLYYFKGAFNGMGNVIYDLTINRPNENYVGLFGIVGNGASITNVGIERANVLGKDNVGILVGHLGDPVYTVGEQRNSTIKYSYTNGNVSGNKNVGGLVGKNRVSIIENSSSHANVKAKGFGGGFVGSNAGGTISESFSAGSVSPKDSDAVYLGGFAGEHSSANSGNELALISDCYSTASVKGTAFNGGFIGYIWGGRARVYSAYSTGKVTGQSSGGFIGTTYAMNEIHFGFWNKETSGQNSAYGVVHQPEVGDPTGSWDLTGLTTVQMVNKASFRGFDFTNIWAINEGKNYPYLKNIVASQGRVQPDAPKLPPQPKPTPNPILTPAPTPVNPVPYTQIPVNNAPNILDTTDRQIKNTENAVNLEGVFKDLDDFINNKIRLLNTDIENTKNYIYERNIGLLKIYSAKSAFSNAIGLFIDASLGGSLSVLQIIERIGNTVTDTDIAKVMISTALSEIFFEKSKNSINNATKSINAIQYMPRKKTLEELIVVIDSLIDAKLFALSGEYISIGEIRRMEEIKSLNPVLESLYWAGYIGLDSVADILFSGVKAIPSKNQIIATPSDVLSKKIANVISSAETSFTVHKDIFDITTHTNDAINNINKAIANDTDIQLLLRFRSNLLSKIL